MKQKMFLHLGMSSEHGQKGAKRGILPGICSIVSAALLSLVILVCAPLTLPRLFGYQVYTVVSGSMEPAIPTDSLVFVHPQEPQEIVAGDIIAFYSETGDGAIITHRVVRNQVVSGEFITKGDANAAEDMNPVVYDALIGRLTWSVPALGRILAMIASTAGKFTVAGLIIVAVILQIAASRLKAEQQTE